MNNLILALPFQVFIWLLITTSKQSVDFSIPLVLYKEILPHPTFLGVVAEIFSYDSKIGNQFACITFNK